MKNKFITTVCPWIVFVSFIIITVYYIIANAQWLIGDDAIVISHTGIGKPFLCEDTIWPEAGRFFPFTYMMYNVLLIFFDSYISPLVHYIFHGICFIFSLFLMLKSLMVVQKNENKRSLVFWISIVGAIFIGARVYSGYINCFSTVWFDTLIQILILFSVLNFYVGKKWLYFILTLLFINYQCYTSEVGFILPLSWGICGFLLRKDCIYKKERFLYYGMILSAIIFLLIYFFIVFINIEEMYDSSHGSGVIMLDNAFQMLFAQKFLWVALLLFCVRFYDIIWRKNKFTIYDLLLFVAAAHCCGGFILKLNWILYYNKAIIYSLPAVIYFSNYYLKPKLTLLIILCFALFYSAKIPNMIKQNKENRIDSFTFVNTLADKIKDGEDVYWYEPLPVNNDLFENDQRDWIQQATEKYLWYILKNPTFKFRTITEYNGETGYILISNKNNILAPNANEIIISNGEYVMSQKERGLQLYKMSIQ